MQISKRDYFAAAALTGLLARAGGPASGLNVHDNLAVEAFLYADSMMKFSKTLLDPVEIDPNKLANEPSVKEKEQK